LRRARRAASRELGLAVDHPDVVEHALCQIGIDQVQASVIAGRAINIETTGKLLDRQKELRARVTAQLPTVTIQYVDGTRKTCPFCKATFNPHDDDPKPLPPDDPEPPPAARNRSPVAAPESKPPAPAAQSMVNVVPIRPKSIHGDGAPLATYDEPWRGHVREIVGQSSRDPFPTDASPQFPTPKKGA
jgi:hypothetical protein